MWPGGRLPKNALASTVSVSDFEFGDIALPLKDIGWSSPLMSIEFGFGSESQGGVAANPEGEVRTADHPGPRLGHDGAGVPPGVRAVSETEVRGSGKSARRCRLPARCLNRFQRIDTMDRSRSGFFRWPIRAIDYVCLSTCSDFLIGSPAVARRIQRMAANFVEGQTVGIDLGTTYSSIAQLDDDGNPRLIKNVDGPDITPSVVLLGDGDRVVVGPSFARIAEETPDRIVEAIKREMGNKDFHVVFKDQKLTPEFVSALILKKLKQDAEKEIGPIGNA
ncbi:MAG: hypothetical protein CM1200mP2_08150 [Planctomycetaceae bacterium]|nr:MAG: hypothetical protein CM1200mP2_08150 [Planctomycetaceae bacterium]